LTGYPSPNPVVCFDHTRPWGSLLPAPLRPARRSRVGSSPVRLRSEELGLPDEGGGFQTRGSRWGRAPCRFPGPASRPIDPKVSWPCPGAAFATRRPVRRSSPPRWSGPAPAPRVFLRVPPVTDPLAQTFAR
jgi:hypothetical protein